MDRTEETLIPLRAFKDILAPGRIDDKGMGNALDVRIVLEALIKAKGNK